MVGRVEPKEIAFGAFGFLSLLFTVVNHLLSFQGLVPFAKVGLL